MLTKTFYLLFAVTSLLICSCTKHLPDTKTFGTPTEVKVQQVKGYIQISFNGPAKPYERILEVETIVGGVALRTRIQVKEGAVNASAGYWANGVLSNWRITLFSQLFY